MATMNTQELLVRIERIESAIRYTDATVAPECLLNKQGEWAQVHFGRASSSAQQLRCALEDLRVLHAEISAIAAN